MREPMIRNFSISGFTIRGFANNGLFTENVDGFSINQVESIDNANYGIFPTLSKNGVIRRSRVTGSGDSGIWVETSQNVLVTNSLVEGNLLGLGVSNSDDIVLANNESRRNSIGLGIFVLPGLFDDRPGAKRITVRNNHLHDNNRENTAPPDSLSGALLSFGAGNCFARNTFATSFSIIGVLPPCPLREERVLRNDRMKEDRTGLARRR
jgi:hypothetical protein